MRLTSNYRRGFSLTEAIVSILVLMILWLAAVNAMIVGKYSASYARHKVQAMYIAQQAIENLRKTPYSLMSSSGPAAVSIDSKGTPDTSADNFNGTQTITVYSEVAGTYFRRVVVKISWNEIFFGRTKQMNEYCGTYIANEPQVN